MPIFEYECPVCGLETEQIKLAGDDDCPPECAHEFTLNGNDPPTVMERITSAPAGVVVKDSVMSGWDNAKLQTEVEKEMVKQGDDTSRWGEYKRENYAMRAGRINVRPNREE